MKKALLALATTAVIATATLAPTTADARCGGCGVGLGILGGVIVGSAIANAYAYPRPYYPVAGYDPFRPTMQRRQSAAREATRRAGRSLIAGAMLSATAGRASSARRTDQPIPVTLTSARQLSLVCTENLNLDVVVVQSAENGV